jgi:hypothetical protein
LIKKEAVLKLKFWNRCLEFSGKTGLDRFFRELVPKPTGFWNKLENLYKLQVLEVFRSKSVHPKVR